MPSRCGSRALITRQCYRSSWVVRDKLSRIAASCMEEDKVLTGAAKGGRYAWTCQTARALTQVCVYLGQHRSAKVNDLGSRVRSGSHKHAASSGEQVIAFQTRLASHRLLRQTPPRHSRGYGLVFAFTLTDCQTIDHIRKRLHFFWQTTLESVWS